MLGSSALQLGAAADHGLLSMHEIRERVRLRPGATVVLSACNSGRGVISGEGVVGLSRAFLAAGAGTVVVSLWKVNDATTKELMERTYSRLSSDARVGVSDALHSAMRGMAREDDARRRSAEDAREHAKRTAAAEAKND
eukprot:3196337-Rhodomonas_salina.1